MRVLVGCERTGAVRDAFRRLGHDAWSCDIVEGGGDTLHDWRPDLYPVDHQLAGRRFHFNADVFELLPGGRTQHTMALEDQAVTWDALIAFPDCTFVCGSGIHWNKRRPGRALLTLEAIAFVERLWSADVYRIAIENPVGVLSTRSILGKPTQIIQPYQFGHDASKATCLWLKNLPPLRPTCFIEPRIVNGRPRWANQTDGGQNRLPPSASRAMDRAATYPGIAAAMAQQWGCLGSGLTTATSV